MDFAKRHMPTSEKKKKILPMEPAEVVKAFEAEGGEITEEELLEIAAEVQKQLASDELDETALDRALKSGALRLAVLDVKKQEPPAEDWPLYGNDRVILTPHMASNTEECMARMALHAAWQIDKVLGGHQPDWPVNQPKRSS